ncbi:MAG: class I SAM-dependent methyltransferase [bacterium]
MHPAKYYDYKNNRPLDMLSDGCDLAEWPNRHEDFRFARHPKGFPIFLPPDRLASSDEYADFDPYAVAENINSEFQARRIELTIDLVNEAVPQAGRPPRILDLGCGQGHITDRIRQVTHEAEVTGLDYSVSAIEYAHERFPKTSFAVGDARDNLFAPRYFDIVVCNNLWEHVPDPLSLLGRIIQVLKPGGYLVMSTPSRYRFSNLVRVLRGASVAFMSQYHVTEYTVGQVKEQLAYGGFEVVRITSRPIGAGGWKAKVARFVFSQLVSIVGSHHQLEATVFYLAQLGQLSRPGTRPTPASQGSEAMEASETSHF